MLTVPLPGLAHALRGLPLGLMFAAAGAATIAAASVGAALAGCACPLVGGAAALVALGGAAALHGLRRPGRSPGRRAWALVAAVVGLPAAAVAGVRTGILDLYYVPTDSMAPTLRPGDTILVSRLAAEPRRGDLVVFRAAGGGLFVKRVAAVAGDRVGVRRGEVWLNGRRVPLVLDPDPSAPLAARYYTETGERRHQVLFHRPWALRPSTAERRVPPGHVFVLGDSRDRSEDSRRLGDVPLAAIVGRPIFLGPSRAPTDDLCWDRAGTLL